MTDAYQDFLAKKRLVAPPTGIENPPPLAQNLFPFQRDLVAWALRRGRAAIFADCGLGKGWMALEWARRVSAHTIRPVLIVAPLAVARQFVDESVKFGLGEYGVKICRDAGDVEFGINVTNYQRLHKFDASVFGGVVLDESSLLKSLDGKTRRLLIESFRGTPFKLCATATPSPNDHTELGGHAEFLGVMSQAEMLATFFVHDGGSTQDWRIKGHARDDFWRWVSSWGAMVKYPSDLGYADDGYALPELRYHEHVVPATSDDARASGMLFAQPAETLNEERAARRGTLESRVRLAAEIANESDRQYIVWAGLNDESVALTKAIRGAVEVTGSMGEDEQEANLESFVRGDSRVLVSKSRIAGFGLNLQSVSDVVFCGVDHSFEAFFQAIRRCWRFGQKNAVDVHVVSSELEGRVVANLKAKQRKADDLSEETRRYVAGHVRANVTASGRDTLSYDPNVPMVLPRWLCSAATL